MNTKAIVGALLLCLGVLGGGCRSAYYSAYEKFGVYKRDLLKKRVVAARDEEKAAGEQFKTAMQRLKEAYGFEGGELEKTFTSLNREYERSAERAAAVRKRIADMNTVASDLFKEWEGEIKQISTPNLREDSAAKLRETRRRYEDLDVALKQAEQRLEPVLTRFHDHVLYLKHNLNAAAIASLKGESLSIQGEISKLLQDMNTAIAQADKFIASMP